MKGLFGRALLCAWAAIVSFCVPASGFLACQSAVERKVNSLSAVGVSSDEIERQLERARELLAKSKAKLEKQEGIDDTSKKNVGSSIGEVGTPFFATRMESSGREGVIKSRDEKTGLITTDGEKMAQLSEDEKWEERSLNEVFQSEVGEAEDVYSMAAQQLADRDVAMSIFNLRKSMMNEDYRAIFDKKNRFIGEDT